MKMDTEMIKSLLCLGFMAKENALEVEEVMEMIEKGFIKMQVQQKTLGV